MPPAPKSPQTRQRRNKVTTAATLEASGPAQKLDLPEDTQWHVRTRSWWDTIWASPMVAEWDAADVPGLILLAALVNHFWETGDPKVAAEIRMQSRDYGLNPMARRSLQWEIKRVEQAPKVAPVPTRARDPRLKAVS